MGRHIVANRDIEVGEVLFHESPIVTYYMAFDPETLGTFIYYVCTQGFFDPLPKYAYITENKQLTPPPLKVPM